MDTHKPKIPLSVFRKMVNALSAAELTKLPPERLPERIPVEFLETLPADISAAIDELIMAQQMTILHARKSLAATYGSEVAGAITLSQRSLEGTAAGDLRRMLTRLRNRRVSSAAKLNINLSLEFLEQLEAGRDLTNQLMDDHRGIIEARQKLRAKIFQLPSPNDELQQADAKLATLSKDFCDLAGHYYAERCELCLIVMDGYLRLQTKRSGLEQAISHRVNTLTGYSGQMEQSFGKQDGKKLHNEVRSLFGKMRDHDFVIDESELTYWLDIVLEFSMFRRKKSRYESLAIKAENTLSAFIKQHFERLKGEHADLRSNRYAPVPVERGDEFEQGSQQFLNSYFERRQGELSHQTCIPATDRLYALRRAQRILG